uniref:Kisspeptin 2 n=1 Tax=Mastacembelus armatus TaxID=205130 RepID=A0A3Q3NDP6_9TELE
MRLVALVVVCGLIVGQDGGSGVVTALPASDSKKTQATGPMSALRRRRAGDILPEDPSLCFSLRENEDLCNDRRNKFNFNPFGLRFGKRYSGYSYRRAIERAWTNKFSPLSPFPQELEVPA